MISYNSQVGEGKYYIQVETDNHEAYLAIQQVIRSFIDFANRQYDEYDYITQKLKTYYQLVNENRIIGKGKVVIIKDAFLGGGSNFIKIGDGETEFNSLPFISGTAATTNLSEKGLADLLRKIPFDKIYV